MARKGALEALIGGTVTAIVLICAIYVASLLASGLLALPIRAVKTVGYGDARRMLLAVHRATIAALVRSLPALLPIVGVLGVIWAAVGLSVTPNLTAQDAALRVGYSLLAGLLGAACSVLLAFAAIRWARSASLRVVVAAQHTSDRLLITALRASLLLTLIVEVFGFGVCLSIFGIAWLSRSSPAPSFLVTALPGVIRNLTSFSVGALLASYALQASGAAYRTAASMGTVTAARDASLADDDPRNPATIADAAGVQLGQLVPQVLDAFCSALCANLLVAIVVRQVLNATPQAGFEPGLLLIPVIMRAFGSLAIVFGLGAARTLESISPILALVRSQTVAALVAIGAIWGCCYWLLADFSVRVALGGTLGLLLPIVVGHWQTWTANRRPLSGASSFRKPNETAWNSSLYAAMVMIVVPLVALAVLFGTALHIGSSLPFSYGKVLATTVCLLAMNMAVPIAASAQTAFSPVFLARRAAHLMLRRRDETGRRRLARLGDALREGTSWATSVQTLYGVALPLLAGAIIGTWSKDSSASSVSTEGFAAALACAISLLLPFAVRLRTSARASHSVAAEVRHQLSAAQREPGSSRIPADFAPSYRGCVDIASRESTRNLFVSVAVASSPGLVLGLSLVWLTKSPGLVSRALAMYLGQAAIAALVAGFVLEVAIEFAGGFRVRSSRSSVMPEAAGENCTIQYLAAGSSPMVRLMATTSVLAAITLFPYLF